jgi:hypothetical protein
MRKKIIPKREQQMVDENEFFREATLKICSSLEIEKEGRGKDRGKMKD